MHSNRRNIYLQSNPYRFLSKRNPYDQPIVKISHKHNLHLAMQPISVNLQTNRPLLNKRHPNTHCISRYSQFNTLIIQKLSHPTHPSPDICLGVGSGLKPATAHCYFINNKYIKCFCLVFLLVNLYTQAPVS